MGQDTYLLAARLLADGYCIIEDALPRSAVGALATYPASKFLATTTMRVYLTLVLPKEDDVGMQGRLTTTVSTKGQVILPKAIRDQRRWPAGTRLTVEDTPDGVLLKATPAFAEASIDMVYGSMKPVGPALSVDEMSAIIAREAKRRARD